MKFKNIKKENLKMKNKPYNLLLFCLAELAILTFVSTTASADYRYVYRVYNDCVTEYITKLSETTHITKACHPSEPLQLDWTTQTYPLLRENPRRVQYWLGGYAKEVTTQSTYLRELVDSCRGKILSEKRFTNSEKQNIDYPIYNVNLSPDISESYMLVPMTRAEAYQELNAAARRCEANE